MAAAVMENFGRHLCLLDKETPVPGPPCRGDCPFFIMVCQAPAEQGAGSSLD